MTASPVPTYSVSGCPVAIAIAPIAWVSSSSPIEAQVAPPSVVFQIPPSAAPMYTVSSCCGSTATAVTRPASMPHPAPKLFTTGSWYVGSSEFTGWGPALCHVEVAPTAIRALA